MPLFSIITPTYNRANFIARTIESVLNQSFLDWEHIIIDDGSTDNTKDIVNAFKDERIRYIYQDNQERSAARNNGIKQARGQYICLLDSDDFYLENHLFVLKQAVLKEKNKEGIYYTRSFLLNMKLDKRTAIIQNTNTSGVDFLLNNFLIPNSVCVSSSLMKQEKFQFPVKYSSWEDMFVWFRIAVEFPLFFIEERTTVIVTHYTNSSAVFAKEDAAYTINRIKCIDDLFEKVTPFFTNLQKKKYITADIYVIANNLVYENQAEKAGDIFLYVLKNYFNFNSLNLYIKLSILIFLKKYFKKGYSFINGRFMRR